MIVVCIVLLAIVIVLELVLVSMMSRVLALPSAPAVQPTELVTLEPEIPEPFDQARAFSEGVAIARRAEAMLPSSTRR